MSLKAFHLIFIVLSILFSLVFGIWAIVNYSSSDKLDELIFGIISLFGSVGMSIYLYFFLKKFKHISYLWAILNHFIFIYVFWFQFFYLILWMHVLFVLARLMIQWPKAWDGALQLYFLYWFQFWVVLVGFLYFYSDVAGSMQNMQLCKIPICLLSDFQKWSY